MPPSPGKLPPMPSRRGLVFGDSRLMVQCALAKRNALTKRAVPGGTAPGVSTFILSNLGLSYHNYVDRPT